MQEILMWKKKKICKILYRQVRVAPATQSINQTRSVF